MQVLAPKDGYIVATLANAGDVVNAGIAIVQMDTTQEDLAAARVTALDATRSHVSIARSCPQAGRPWRGRQRAIT